MNTPVTPKINWEPEPFSYRGFVAGRKPPLDTAPKDICWLIVRRDMLAAERVAQDDLRGISRIEIASITQTAPMKLLSRVYTMLPRAAYRGLTYSGDRLTPQDIGTSRITRDTLDVIISEYICGIANILPARDGAGDSALQQMMVRVVFSGADWQASTQLTRGVTGHMLRGCWRRYIKKHALIRGHLHVLAALELTGEVWTPANVELAGRRLAEVTLAARPILERQNAQKVLDYVEFWKAFAPWRPPAATRATHSRPRLVFEDTPGMDHVSFAGPTPLPRDSAV